jgi:non-heme Fe2+,alpha-ketoglutarate-dependent halogenase
MAISDALPDMQRELKFYRADVEKARTLSRDQVQRFNEQGYLCPLTILAGSEMDEIRSYFESLMDMARDSGLNSYSVNGWQTTCARLYDLVMDDRILDPVADLAGPNLVCTMTHFFSKPPGDGKQVSWHQDASYWPLTPSKAVTVWLAIDDVDEEMGPMRVIPASHLQGQIAFEHSKPEENNVLGQTVTNPDDFGEPVSFVMNAGQGSMHTDLLLHGSEPNRSPRRRCGLTLRYMPPDVRGRDPEHQSAIIARGEDPSGYWQHVERPKGEEIPERMRNKGGR